MSYKNPKAAPINTGAAVYEGINKLAGDVFTFANNERDRKGQLVADSLAAQQAVDDNVNKMGLSLDEDDNNFETQIFAEAQAAKKAIAAQYETMSKTFSSPEQRAKAKSEIARLNKYPENLVADLSTGKYITDMYDKAMQLQQGKTGSISKSNDINLLAVAGDMKTGGKNTKIETNAAGSRTLVTTVGKDTYKLNISNITNGLKTNPNQILFKTVQDDSPDVKMYQSALGIGDKASIDALIGSGKLNKTSSFDRSGKPMDLYTLDEAEADKAVSGLSASLLDVPGNYTYANTIWQDRLGEGISITEAVKKEGRESVLNKIRTYYKDKAITDAKLQFGVAIGYAKPKVETATKATKAEIEQKKYNELVGRFKGDAKKGGFFDKFTEAANKHLHGNYTKKKKDEDLRELLSERGLSILPIYDTKNELIEDVQMIKDKNTGKSIEISADRISKKELMDAVLVMQGIELPDIQDITRDPLAPNKN